MYTDDSTLSKSMTLMVGSAPHRNAGAAATPSASSSGGKHHRGDSASARSHHSHRVAAPESGSDTSASPVNEFSNTPTYRVPTKSCGGSAGASAASSRAGHGGSSGGGGVGGTSANDSMLMFRPDSSTESNNGDQSPVPERRATAAGTPRHVPASEQRSSVRMGRLAKAPPRDGGHSMDLGRAVSNNR